MSIEKNLQFKISGYIFDEIIESEEGFFVGGQQIYTEKDPPCFEASFYKNPHDKFLLDEPEENEEEEEYFTREDLVKDAIEEIFSREDISWANGFVEKGITLYEIKEFDGEIFVPTQDCYTVRLQFRNYNSREGLF